MILVILDKAENHVKKASLEAISYAASLGEKSGQKVCGIIAEGVSNLGDLNKYGMSEVYEFKSPSYIDTQQWTEIISQAYHLLNPDYIILSNNSLGKSISGRLAVKLNLALISNVIGLKKNVEDVVIQKSVFSGKASAWYRLKNAKGILALMPNGYGLHEQKGSYTKILNLDINIPDSKIVLKDRVLIKGKTPLSEADIVVSAGRGMKDPSNWNLIEELADLVNATTACSRPVADSGWRPHHEHVGQTGIAIRPNVYIAIGISGAIQHLAGVNNSKKIFVINKDPEAPFFKAADYGVCGDLFEILPKLNEALRKAK
ncbi:MAG: electron transfer flavoprotein subunit alpha/FixB family protein [Saprospiraceae bacterium]|nr:electron transfer flavoprotein subunit alpha/FixB family protein [Saprospiraceae bacterium]